MPSLREDSLRGYFDGTVSPAELDAEAAASLTDEPSGSAKIVRHHIGAMAHDYDLTIPHLLKVLDDVIAGRIGLRALDAICFCLEASDHFTWQEEAPVGDRIPEVLFWLGTPEVNVPLSPTFLVKVREYLETGRQPFDD